jgi:hypothetical protein
VKNSKNRDLNPTKWMKLNFAINFTEQETPRDHGSSEPQKYKEIKL